MLFCNLFLERSSYYWC